jgi:hypothetical protein
LSRDAVRKKATATANHSTKQIASNSRKTLLSRKEKDEIYPPQVLLVAWSSGLFPKVVFENRSPTQSTYRVYRTTGVPAFNLRFRRSTVAGMCCDLPLPQVVPIEEFVESRNAVRLAATSVFYSYCHTIPGIPYQILYQRPVTLSRFCVSSKTLVADNYCCYCQLPKTEEKTAITFHRSPSSADASLADNENSVRRDATQSPKSLLELKAS